MAAKSKLLLQIKTLGDWQSSLATPWWRPSCRCLRLHLYSLWIRHIPPPFILCLMRTGNSSNQRLESISFSEKVVSYLHNKSDDTDKFRIDVDLTLEDTGQSQVPKTAELIRRRGRWMTPRLTPAALTISGEVPDDPNCDTRAFVGPIRCDCCGGHPGNGKCPTVPGGGGGPQEPHPVTFVNRSGATLYIYYALYKGGTLIP